MIIVDAYALINDLNKCTQEPFMLHVDEVEKLAQIAYSKESARDDGTSALSALEWLYNYPDCYIPYSDDALTECPGGFVLASLNRPITLELTGRYDKAVIGSKYGVKVEYVPKFQSKQDYTGWMLIEGEQAAEVYDEEGKSTLGALPGQYVMVRDEYGSSDARKWNGEKCVPLPYRVFHSDEMGDITPKDMWQRCAFDSLVTNDITVLYGASGTGKTLLPLAYAMQELSSGRLSRCHFIFHYEKLRYARELGYVKGTLHEKLLQTGSIGNILSSKLGDPQEVELLIREGKINVMPTNAIRGFEAGENEMIFCTEAQDMDAYTIRTIIQRAKKGCKIVLEGDVDEQVDIARQSGLGQVIDVFKGWAGFGCVKLVNDYRSPFGRLADNIR